MKGWIYKWRDGVKEVVNIFFLPIQLGNYKNDSSCSQNPRGQVSRKKTS